MITSSGASGARFAPPPLTGVSISSLTETFGVGEVRDLTLDRD